MRTFGLLMAGPEDASALQADPTEATGNPHRLGVQEQT